MHIWHLPCFSVEVLWSTHVLSKTSTEENITNAVFSPPPLPTTITTEGWACLRRITMFRLCIPCWVHIRKTRDWSYKNTWTSGNLYEMWRESSSCYTAAAAAEPTTTKENVVRNMAWRNVFSSKKIKQKSAKAVNYALWCHPPWK